MPGSNTTLIVTSDGYEVPVGDASSSPNTKGIASIGTDGSNNRIMAVDSSGRQIIIGAGVSGTPVGGVVTVQGIAGGTAQPISGTVTSNIGTTNGLALDATLAKLTIAQSTALGTNTVAMMGGSVTTAAPTYTTGNINPLSLTTGGLLRVDASGTTQTVTVSSGSIVVTQPTASNLNATAKITDGTNIAVIKAASTAAAATDPALVVSLSPNSPLPAGSNNIGTVNVAGLTLPFTVIGNVAVGAATSGAPVLQGFSDGTNIRYGLSDSSGRPITRLTDGSNFITVKPASTGAVVSDTALVVTLSPNYSPDPIITGNLNAINQTVTITTAGKYTVGGNILGTWVGTIISEGSTDGGASWFAIRTANKSTNDIVFQYTANDNFEFYSHGGCTHVRVRMTAYTSGTANISLAATSTAQDALLNYSGTNVDTAPPLRHLSIGTLTNDNATFNPLRNTDTTPLGTEFSLITRSINYGEENTSFSPDPSGYDTANLSPLYVDDSGNLAVRGQILTDEGSFRDDFAGTTLTVALPGTPSWTNGSITVTGTGFQTGVKTSDYIKKTADANTLYVRVASVDSDTSLTLESAYTGTTAVAAGVKSNWIPTIGASGAIAVATSNLTITTGTTSGVINSLIRRGDYGPFTVRMQATVSQRIANQDLRIGLSNVVSSLVPDIGAFVQFTGTVNTTVNFITSSSVAVADTQTTAVTLPNGGTTATSHEYKIDVSSNQCTLTIDGVVVARNTLHIPGPYDNLALIALAANTALAGSSTTLTIDYAYFANIDRIQTDNDFPGEALPLQGGTSVAQVLDTKPITVSGTDLNNQVRALKTATDGTMLVSNVDGFKATYSAAIVGLVPPATPTDIFTITGSASKIIRINRIALMATQTTASSRDVLLIKRSTANTAGTSTTLTNVPFDSTAAAATAVVRAYTANPTLGTTVGTIRSRKVFISTPTGNNSNADEMILEFGVRNSQSLILRGTSEVISVNLNSVTSTGNLVNLSIEWTEE